MRRLCLFFCSTLTSLDIRRRLPKILKALSDFSKILNPQEARSTSSSRQNVVASGVQVETCGPCRIAARIVSKDQGSPTASGKPWNAKFYKRFVSGCWAVGSEGGIVGYWHDLMKSFNSGTDASVVRVTDTQCAIGSREVGKMEHW